MLIVKSDEEVGKYREEMRSLQGYSTLHGLPQDLRESMQRHLKLHFYNADAADETVLKAYPSSIRRKVLRQLYLPMLQKSYLFDGAKQRFLDALLSVARIELYLPQVEIASQGDYVNELFILVAGGVTSYSAVGKKVDNQLEDSANSTEMSGDITSTALPDVSERQSLRGMLPHRRRKRIEDPRTVEDSLETGNGQHEIFSTAAHDVRYLSEGDVFGEIAFFTCTAQTETMVTTKTTRVLAISRSAFEQVAAKFPTSHKMVLHRLDDHCEDAALDLFPGPEGFEIFKIAMSEEGRHSPSSSPIGSPGGVATPKRSSKKSTPSGFLRNFTGGDPTWLLAADRAASLKLTPQQELAIGALLQVKGAVARAVAQHDADKTNEWLTSAARGDTVKIREMLRHGFDVNNTDFNKHTALMLASACGFEDLVEVLLTAGADPNIIDDSGNTALLKACKGGHDEIIDILLTKGAILGAKGADEGTLLCQVVHECDLNLLRRLLRCGANPDAANFDGRTALHVAASEGIVPAVELLISYGADSTKKDRWGATALEDANRVGAKVVQDFLVKDGGNSSEK